MGESRSAAVECDAMHRTKKTQGERIVHGSIGSTVEQIAHEPSGSVVGSEGFEKVGVLGRSQATARDRLDLE
jgi:hypothetical protein